MTSIDGRITGLNAQTFNALKQINTQDGIDHTEAAKLKEAIEADGQVDENEADLLDELMSNQNQIMVESQDAEFSPLQLQFNNVPAGQPRVDQRSSQEFASLRIEALAHGHDGPETADQTAKDAKHWQHLFHECHLGGEAIEQLAHFMSHNQALARVLKSMPKSLQIQMAKMLGEVAGKYGGKALHALGKALESKLMHGVAIVGDAFSAGYYGSLASGLNYPNVNINGTEYEVRPSAGTKALAGMTAAISGGSIAATATGAGAGAGIALSIASLIAGGITDWSLDRDKEILKNVVEKVMQAPDGPALQRGLEELRSEYGSLADVQQVLGQAPISQTDGRIVHSNQDQSNTVDRDLVGAVANRILEAGMNGELSEAETRRSISELMGGASTRWTSDDDVAQSFVNQIFLRFGQNEETFKKALGMLGPEVRLSMFKMLDGGVTWGETGLKSMDWLLNESSQDLSEARVMEFLAGAETDITTRGRMIAHLMDGATRQRFEDLAFNLIDRTYQQSIQSGNFRDFNKLLKEIKLDSGDASMLSQVSNELDADRAGKVLAWMIQSGAPKSQVESYIREMSTQWTNDDNVTSEFLGELQRLHIDNSVLSKALSQNSVRLLMSNLEAGWTTNSEYGQIEQLASIADGPSKAYIINRLMDGATFTRAESAIGRIIGQSSNEQMRGILQNVNTVNLGDEMEDSSQYGAVLKKILATGDDTKLAQYLNGGSQEAVLAAYASLSTAERGRLGDQAKVALFKHFVNAGRFEDSQSMLRGIGNAASRREMSTYMAQHVTNFSNTTEAGKAAAWIMANGSQSDIDTCFRNISGKWFGKGGEIVKAALDQARTERLDIRGKLSLNTLQSMVGSLNTAWTKMFGDYESNLRYVRELASVTNTEGKIAIINDLMSYWTPGQAETLIHDIFRDTTDRSAFTQMVDRIGPARISSELENRQELGRVMAFMIERYNGNLDQTLGQVMNQWSNSSIQSDDIIQAMVEQLGGGRGILSSGLNSSQAQAQLRRLSNRTLEEMIDWSDDAFRDGNVLDLDPETQRTLQVLRASKH